MLLLFGHTPDPFYSGNGQVAQMEVFFSPESAWGAASVRLSLARTAMW
jgi:hypothetical protein